MKIHTGPPATVSEWLTWEYRQVSRVQMAEYLRDLRKLTRVKVRLEHGCMNIHRIGDRLMMASSFPGRLKGVASIKVKPR